MCLSPFSTYFPAWPAFFQWFHVSHHAAISPAANMKTVPSPTSTRHDMACCNCMRRLLLTGLCCLLQVAYCLQVSRLIQEKTLYSVSSPLVVNTSNGQVYGRTLDTAFAFLGVPYGEPPKHSLRWRDPLPARPWAPLVYNATSFGPACPQHCHLPPLTCPQTTKEDCLNLDIWVPLTATSQSNLSVMVFFPGGR